MLIMRLVTTGEEALNQQFVTQSLQVLLWQVYLLKAQMRLLLQQTVHQSLKTILVFGIAKPYGTKSTTPTYADDAALASAAVLFGNVTLVAATDAGINDPFNQTAPNFLLKAESQAKTGSVFTGLDSFFTQVAYKGAFDTTNWTAGWANFNPQNTAY